MMPVQRQHTACERPWFSCCSVVLQCRFASLLYCTLWPLQPGSTPHQTHCCLAVYISHSFDGVIRPLPSVPTCWPDVDGLLGGGPTYASCLATCVSRMLVYVGHRATGCILQLIPNVHGARRNTEHSSDAQLYLCIGGMGCP